MNNESSTKEQSEKKERVLRKESPLKGWPRTRPTKKGDGFRVRAVYMTPGRVKFAENAASFVIFLGFAAWCWAFLSERLVGEPLVVAGVVYLALSSLLWAIRIPLGQLLFGKITKLEFLPDAIRIKNGLFFRNYDRALPHEFDVTVHDKAEEEQEREIEAYYKDSQKKKNQGDSHEKARRKFYRKSFHVIMRYAGQRVNVADVYGKNRAEALVVRLQLLDQLMEALRGDPTTSQFADTEQQYGARPAAD